MKKSTAIALIAMQLLVGFQGYAKSSLTKDLDALGANRDLVNKASRVSGDSRIRIVQKRAVDRDYRFEGFVDYGALAGGDPYLSSGLMGLNLDFHISPKFSLGVRHQRYNNSLSNEGNRLADSVETTGRFPDVFDYMTSTTMGTLTWYPIYGKINWFDLGVTQFDIYAIGGAGTTVLVRTGDAPTYTLGGGVAFWLSNHFSTRFELRYQTLEDQVISSDLVSFSNRRLNQTIFTFAVGFLL